MLAFVGISYITTSTQLSLTDSDRISFVIAMVTSSGGLVSVAFVVFSYWQTNEAHIDAQRPQLLVQMNNSFQQNTNLPVSVISYKNVTRNKFDDLTISVTLSADGKECSLNHLFRKKMTMIGLDERHRNFQPYHEVSKLGVDMQKLVAAGKEVRLRIGYHYTFYGSNSVVNEAQRYVWNAKSKTWDIS